MPNPRTKLTFIRRLCKDKSHKKTLTSNLQIQPPTETRTENYQPMLKKSLFFALGFCFVLLEAEVNVFLCDLSLHRRLMKVNFVLGFGIAITNSRGFNR